MVNSRVAMVGSHAAKLEMHMKRILGQKASPSELLHRVDHSENKNTDMAAVYGQDLPFIMHGQSAPWPIQYG